MSIGKSIFKPVYKLHVYVGLFVAVHFAVFAITGLALLFKEEFEGGARETIVEPEKPSPESASRRYAAILASIAQEFPSDRPLALFPDEQNPSVIQARLGVDGATRLRGSRRPLYDLASGDQVPKVESTASGFFDWTLRLHREFFLGSTGKIYVGLVGLAYVFSLVSGFFIYGRFMRGRSLGEIRRAVLPQLVDLHKFVGVVTFGWSLVVGLSGVFLAFNGWLIKLFQYQSLKHLALQYQNSAAAGPISPETFARVVNTALIAKPESVLSYISFPDTEFGIPGHFLILVNGTTKLTERLSELIVVNAQTGQLADVMALPLYLKIVLLSEPLHFGDYGGIFLKVIWAFFTLCSLAVALFGFASFFMKRRNRDAPRTGGAPAPSRRTKSPRPAPYGIPAALVSLVLAGLVLSLFSEGWLSQISSGLLLVPLLIVLFGRRRNA